MTSNSGKLSLGEPRLPLEKRGKIGIIAIHGINNARSDTTALDERLLEQIQASFSAAVSDAEIEIIRFRGDSSAFLLGADLKFFVRCVLAGDLDRLLRFTRAAHQLLAQIAQGPKPTVAWVEGPALGAGLELALACGRIVAAPTAKFAFPETGMGIYPGMGGTQRTTRRIGVGLTKWMIYTGAVVPARQALEIGLIDAINPPAAEISEVTSAIAALPPRAALADPRWQVLRELFDGCDSKTLLDPALPSPANAHAVRAVAQMKHKGPVALRLAEAIIDRGATLPLAEALEIEFAHLAEIFSTADARAGLLSFGRSQPHFTGN